jgi:rRNA maturation protein Nop10
MDNRVGTCSKCGGPVVVPLMMIHPTPHCQQCGAIAKNPHGPRIEMDEPKSQPKGEVLWGGYPLTWGDEG